MMIEHLIEHPNVREILARNPELAQRLGNNPPELIVGFGTSPIRLQEHLAAGFRPVIDERAARLFGEIADPPRFEVDPVTGMSEFKGSFYPQVNALAGAPPSIVESTRSQYLGNAAQIDRFSANPGRDYWTAALPGAEFVGSAPQMFNTGDLPPITGSGVEPSILRWVAWQMRHTAAFTASRSHVLELIEASSEIDMDDSLQNEAGRSHLASYFARIGTWVSTPPVDQGLQDLTIEDITRFYPPGPDNPADD